MKKILIAVTLLTSISSTLACRNSNDKLLCANDVVISKSGYVGKVIGVKPRSSKVAVKWSTTPKGYSTNNRSTVRVEEISVGRGCLSYFCVNDTVVSKSGYVGYIIGLNPHTSSAAIRWKTTPKGYSTNHRTTVKVKKLSIGRGCVYGICVEDTVISENGYIGRVIGVNPHNSQAAVRWGTTPKGYSTNHRTTISIDELYIEKFCRTYGEENRGLNISIRLRGAVEITGFDLRYTLKL